MSRPSPSSIDDEGRRAHLASVNADPDKAPLRLSDLANLAGALTLARIPLAMAAWILKRDAGAMLLILGLFALFDALDGPIARRTGTSSRTGAVADGWTDKIFLVDFAWALQITGRVPSWMLLLWFAREILQLPMFPLLSQRYLVGRAAVPLATAAGRTATISVTTAMVAALLSLSPVLYLASVVAGVSGTWAAVQYALRDKPWRRLIEGPLPEEPRPDSGRPPPPASPGPS